MKKPTTAKQLAANQRNARKSTGPRTSKDRAVSRMNALKHGILSKQVLVRSMVFREDETELDALHQRFREEFQPSGPLEEMLVDQIVTAQWRLKRALLAESGEISHHMDRTERRHLHGIEAITLWIQWAAALDFVQEMRQSSMGNSVLLLWLSQVHDAVEAEGILTETPVQKLASHFNGKSNSLLSTLKDFCQKITTETAAHPEGLDAGRKKQHKMEVVSFLQREMDMASYRMERCVVQEKCEGEARKAASMLPSTEVLDKILRYETKLERQMYRAMAQLERVQRMRRGEAIPAPLSLDVSDRG